MGRKNCQRVAKIDHLVQPDAEKIFCMACGQFAAPKKEKFRKTALKTQKT